MFDSLSAPLRGGHPRACFRRSLSLMIAGCATVVLAAVTAPVLAQATSQNTPGSAQKDPGRINRTTHPSGPARNTSRSSRRGTNKTMTTPDRIVLVFPTDAKGGMSDQLADVITDTIQGRLAASGRYQSVYFLRSIPMVQRGLNEATLTTNEVSHPFDDDAKLRKLMPLTGYDLALTTSIDSYTYDEKKNQVTMLISARLIDFRGEKPVARAAAENGSSPENGGNVREIVLATQAARNLSEKLITSLLSQERPTPASGAGATAAPTTTGGK